MKISRTTTINITPADDHVHLTVTGAPNGVCVKAIVFNTDDPSDTTVFTANRTKSGECYSNGNYDSRVTGDPVVVALVREATQ